MGQAYLAILWKPKKGIDETKAEIYKKVYYQKFFHILKYKELLVEINPPCISQCFE